LVNPSSHQVRNGNCRSVGNIAIPHLFRRFWSTVSRAIARRNSGIFAGAQIAKTAICCQISPGGRFGPFLNRCPHCVSPGVDLTGTSRE
jgi:hypothetical protein